MTKKLQEAAPKILQIIKESNNILLHLHPSPDPDSMCSALAMEAALEQLGKKATIVRGDSPTPSAFSHFPGAEGIAQKSFAEMDLSQYDLFIVQDSGSLDRVSAVHKIDFPESLKIILIDHHASNKGFGLVSLVDSEYGATAQMLADLFKIWGIKITHDIAQNLILGMYTDTGGFKFVNTTPALLTTVAELSHIAPDYMNAILTMDSQNTRGNIAFQALAYSSVETFLGGRFALSSVSAAQLAEKGITAEDTSASEIANMLKSVVGWEVTACMVEFEAGNIKMSFRTRNQDVFDVAKIAVSLGGGGHRSASGVPFQGITLEEAKKRVVDAVTKSV